MSRSRSLLVATLILTALGGCSRAEETRPCFLVGAPKGISINIDTVLAERVDTAQMNVCWDGSCQTLPVILQPSSRVVDEDCTGGRPDAVCSARMAATGEKTGFAAIRDLPASPVEVTVTLTDPAGTRIVDQTLTLTPRMVKPPGENCGGDPQGRITVGADGRARSAD